MTRRATELGVLIPSIAATDPQLWVGPYIIEASSCTTPFSFGSPPNPTDPSSGSNSVIFADCSTASKRDPFFLRIDQPGLRTFLPHFSPRLHTIIGLCLAGKLFPDLLEIDFAIAGILRPSIDIVLMNFLLSIIFSSISLIYFD